MRSLATQRPNIPEDRAGKAHWDKAETNQRVAGAVFDGRAPGLRNFAKRSLHRFFAETFSGMATGLSLLELGCGGSRLLPYFANEFGFKVAGIDYSESGCEVARSICREHDCQANIVCCDMFQPTPGLRGMFDIVVSFGLVEHFTDTAAALRTCRYFLKPQGLMVTSVPNLGGLPGAAQRIINREIFDKHVALSANSFKAAHESAGLRVRRCQFQLFLNFGVVNPGTSRFPQRMLWQGLRMITGLSWAVESIIGPLPPNGLSSPYIFCVSEPLGCRN